MRVRNLIIPAVIALVPAMAQAQGVIVEGPVGIVADEPPAPVITYVERAPVPSVVVPEEDVVVGAVLPDTVMVRVVPDYDTYGYAVVNDTPVVVEPRTHRVIRVIER
jgi:hypothetical protein